MSDLLVQPSPVQSGKPEPWQREFLSHAPEYGAEFAGTCFLMWCVVATVAAMFAPQSPVVHAIGSAGVRLFLTGLILGGAGGLVAITPLGRISGAHLNPAISIGFFAEGKMNGNDLGPYIVAQMLGAWLGAWLGAAAFPHLASAVSDALNQPGQHVSTAMAIAAEFGATFALATVVFFMVSHKSLMKWTPLAATVAVGILVWLDGNFSGASMNPARSFGPVLATGDWRLYWIYIVGPCAGAAAAGLLHRFAAPVKAKTGKMFHDLHYRSIFKGESDHEANTHVRRHSGQSDEECPAVHKQPTSK